MFLRLITNAVAFLLVTEVVISKSIVLRTDRLLINTLYNYNTVVVEQKWFEGVCLRTNYGTSIYNL